MEQEQEETLADYMYPVVCGTATFKENKMLFARVEWDLEVNEADGLRTLTLKEAGLSSVVQLPAHLEDLRGELGDFVEDDRWLDEVSDWLSDEHGFCHYGFEVISEGDSIYNQGIQKSS